MNIQRFVMAVIAAYIAFAIAALGTDMLLTAQLVSLAAVFNPTPEPLSFFGGQLLQTIVFCYIFTIGYENKGIMEGVRYGLLFGAFMAGAYAVIYSLTAISASGLVWWVLQAFIIYAVAGATVAAVYRPADEAASA